MIRSTCALAIFALTFGAGEIDSQGRLQSVRDDVSAATTRSSGSSSPSSDHEDGILGGFLKGLFSATDCDGNSVFGPALLV